MKTRIIVLLFLLFLAYNAHAQIEVPVKWSYASKKISSQEAGKHPAAPIF